MGLHSKNNLYSQASIITVELSKFIQLSSASAACEVFFSLRDIALREASNFRKI